MARSPQPIIWLYLDESYRTQLSNHTSHAHDATAIVHAIFLRETKLNVDYELAWMSDARHGSNACNDVMYRHAGAHFTWVANPPPSSVQPAAEHGSHLFLTGQTLAGAQKGCGSVPLNPYSPVNVAPHRVALGHGTYTHAAGDDFKGYAGHLAITMAHELAHNWGQTFHKTATCAPRPSGVVMRAGVPASAQSYCLESGTEAFIDDAVSGAGW